MKHRDVLLTLFAVAVLFGSISACAEPIAVPTCAPMATDTARVSGDTVVTVTDLRFIDGVSGAGAAVEWCRGLAIHYVGSLLDGTVFDDSRAADRPLIFTPGYETLIDGIEQGVIGMRTGATRRLVIPPELGFGAEARRDGSGQVVVPPNSTVIFDIEILQIAQ